MGFEFWMIGKTGDNFLKEGIAHYEKLVSRHMKIIPVVLPDPKHASKLNATDLKRQEALVVSKNLQATDFLILLDERGKLMDSRQFAGLIEMRMNDSGRKTIFLIGGAYGFDQTLYDRSNARLSLSKMTFSHQLIRLIFWEQIYRGISILKGLPYHND